MVRIVPTIRMVCMAWMIQGDKAGAAGNCVAVISCGKRNMYGHPAPETIGRLKEAGFTIYRTDQNGAVIVDLP